MDQSTMEAMSRRLGALERENRLGFRLGCAAVLGLLALVGAGTDLFRTPRSIEAREVVLRDRDGKVRARLGMADDGSPTLALLDAAGREKLTLEGTADGSAALSFYDKGDLRVNLSSSPSGASVLNFFDRKNRSATGLYLWPDSTTGLGFRNGATGLHLAAQPDGRAGLAVLDADGRPLGQVGALGEAVVKGDGQPIAAPAAFRPAPAALPTTTLASPGLPAAAAASAASVLLQAGPLGGGVQPTAPASAQD